MQFKDVIGQETLKKHLLKSVKEGRIPHAHLLWESEGYGAFPLALAYAQYLNCHHRTETDSCGECPSCRQFSNLAHPDLHFIFPFAADKPQDARCDQMLPTWREFVKAQPYFGLRQWMAYTGETTKKGMIYSNESEVLLSKLQLKSYEADYKTILIWLPETMNASCSNKLLKILEEPPAGTVFLLVSEHPEQLLQTVVSRTQMLRVGPVDAESMSQHFSPEIVHLAGGSVTQARQLVGDEGENRAYFELYRQLMNCVVTKNLVALKSWSEQLAGSGREQIAGFLEYAQHLTREAFIRNLNNEQLSYYNPYENEFLQKFMRCIHTGNIERVSEEWTRAHREIGQNANSKLVLFDLGLQLLTQIKL
ncbi:MAG: DNA polymerase III subunit delta [Paludibacteraceae bacterium]|nr:DNA polymerase III subunit delta [Paludibacteraceae bacterium]